VKLHIEWRDENPLEIVRIASETISISIITIIISDGNDRKFKRDNQKSLPDHRQEAPNRKNENFTPDDQ
jgi:hypothetical protein